MNKISVCGVAVISNPMVCHVCVLHATVFGEMKIDQKQREYKVNYLDNRDFTQRRRDGFTTGFATESD